MKKIEIPLNVTYLYASVFECCKTYFAAPEDVIVTIDSEDASYKPKSYKHNTNTDSLYIQMTPNGQSLQKLFVKDPAPGWWTITVQAKTKAPVYFQFQTVPKEHFFDTIRDTLSSSYVLGLN